MEYVADDRKFRPPSPMWRASRGRGSRRILLIVILASIVFVLLHHSHSLSSSVRKYDSTQSRERHFWSKQSAKTKEKRHNKVKTPKHVEVEEVEPTEENNHEQHAEEEQATDQLPADSGVTKKVKNSDESDGPDDTELVPKSEKKQGKKESSKKSTGSEQQAGQSEQQPILNVQDMAKGPISLKPDLDKHNEKEKVLSSPDVPAKEKVIEAEPEAHLTIETTADSLPDLIHIPFDKAVEDYELEGWEDEWIAGGKFDAGKWKLKEPKIDFVYLWVNGSQEAFQTTKRPFEENSVLNDPEGKWINSHGVNRYRDWDELRYSIRSVEKYASSFRNHIQILVNSVVEEDQSKSKQSPTWLKGDSETLSTVQVLSQEEIFDPDKHACLPTFNSLTIENQLFNAPSDTDYVYALSDDMLLGKPHAASDIHSPLFGPVMGFKTNSYNTINTPTENDARRFGEKPYLIYTSWLLNRRFGNRKRKGQGHFGHALSRAVMKEAISSFPGPELQSACKRFRGEPGFQLYSWYVTFHYLIERHREAMIWSYILQRSDTNGDGFLDWSERKKVMQDLAKGIKNEGKASFRKRNFLHTVQLTERAGLQGPVVNNDVLWTSLDGPSTIMGLECAEFNVNECLAPGFSISSESMGSTQNPMFSTPLIFDRLARQKPDCGDCLLKILLNQVRSGLSPVLPKADTQPKARETVVKALMKYRYQIVNPDALFMMVTDAEQVDATLTRKYVRGNKQLAGQLCLNDDVTTTDDQELRDVMLAMSELYTGLFPDKSPFET